MTRLTVLTKSPYRNCVEMKVPMYGPFRCAGMVKMQGVEWRTTEVCLKTTWSRNPMATQQAGRSGTSLLSFARKKQKGKCYCLFLCPFSRLGITRTFSTYRNRLRFIFSKGWVWLLPVGVRNRDSLPATAENRGLRRKAMYLLRGRS